MNEQTVSSSVVEELRPNVAVRSVKAILRADAMLSYLFIILLAVLGTYIYSMRVQGIFSCPGNTDGADYYLAYCGAKHFGDYDHGAIWFDLEPKVRDSARSAEVMFLGSSRMQFGFSSDATEHWFAAHSASYYLMGFAYWENYLFAKPLLSLVQPRARVYVVNIDTFFENTESAPARTILHDRDAYTRYRQKHDLEALHGWLCTAVPSACGRAGSFYRSRSTGAYVYRGGDSGVFPVSYDRVVNKTMALDYTTRAAPFLAGLPVASKCLILTMVPTTNTPMATARDIAQSLGATFIAPEPDGLATYDGSHMNRPSAEIWATAFFEAAGPVIGRCLGKSAQ